MQLKPSCVASALGAFLLFVHATHSTAFAEVNASADARTSVYQDTDHTFISTTAVSAKLSPIDLFTLKGRYIADVVTSASVDVVSAATKIAFDDLRHEGTGSVSYQDGTRTASLAYVYSTEHDWRSHSVSGGFSSDFLAHQLTLGIGGSFTTNDVGRASDPNFHRALNQGSVSVDAAIVASKRDLFTLDYTMIHLEGYQASPYRFVRILNENVTIPGIYLSAPEDPPEGRTRHALALRWNRAIAKESALKSHVRGYLDDWGIKSVTAGTEYVVGFGAFDVGMFVRGYAQTKATFYQPIYDIPRRFMTSDRELATFFDVFGGARLSFARPLGPFEEVRAELKGTGFAFHFIDFPRLVNRYGLIAEFALGVSI